MEFIFEKTAYLSDTNSFRNVYFAKYFEWQGAAREEFLKQTYPDYENLISSGIIIKTIEASMKYIKDAHLFDVILIYVKPFNVNLASYEISFIFKNKKSGEIIGEGHEKVAFMNSKGRFAPIPLEIIKNGLPYLTEKKDIMKAQMLIKAKQIYHRFLPK